MAKPTHSKIMKAIKANDLEQVQQFSNEGADFSYSTDNDGGYLHQAAYFSQFNTEMTKNLIAALIEGGADVNCLDEYGNTPLCLASSFEAMEALIDAGSDVSVKNKNGRTAAFNIVNIDMMKALDAQAFGDPIKFEMCAHARDHGIDLNSKDDCVNTPLAEAMAMIGLEPDNELVSKAKEFGLIH